MKSLYKLLFKSKSDKPVKQYINPAIPKDFITFRKLFAKTLEQDAPFTRQYCNEIRNKFIERVKKL